MVILAILILIALTAQWLAPYSPTLSMLIAVLSLTDNVILDFSGVRRMDFSSAGQLVNILAPFKAGGKDVIVRSPNHLVAELMAVVGLNKVARIIVPKS